MNTLIRVASVSNKITLGNPAQSVDDAICVLNSVRDYSPDIILFPSYTLTGSQLGNLSKNPAVIAAYTDALNEIFKRTKKLDSYVILSGISLVNGSPQNITYAVYHGEIVGVADESDDSFVLSLGCAKVNIITQAVTNIIKSPEKCSFSSFDINLLPANISAYAGDADDITATLSAASKRFCCGFAFANGSVGDTSFPYMHRGVVASFECCKPLGFKQNLENSLFVVTDFDTDIIRVEKANAGISSYTGIVCHSVEAPDHFDVMRILDTEPYLPTCPDKRRKYLLDLFKLQAASLMTRLQNIGTDKVTIGVSGGLDSTLALLVCYKALLSMCIPSNNIIAVTMSGFGTSDKTYDNAVKLMDALGCTVRSIPIKDSVLQHFSDIGHDETNHNIVFENAQARERTQILLDISNSNGSIVVGTGDLSESALGFSTFAGDQIAGYNVNICIPKTAIRYMVLELADTKIFANYKDILLDILDTPISPELLPPDNNGSISQKTESILGAYELHDFFLYYFVSYNFAPSKIHAYALKAFAGKYDSVVIKDKLEIFLKRFCSGQFKRSCTPDAAVLTRLNLSNAEFSIPSDISADILLDDLKNNC